MLGVIYPNCCIEVQENRESVPARPLMLTGTLRHKSNKEANTETQTKQYIRNVVSAVEIRLYNETYAKPSGRASGSDSR